MTQPKSPPPRLGRGLWALLSETEADADPFGARAPNAPAEAQPDEVLANRLARLVPIEKIRPNPRQPRRRFDEGALEELSRSIKEKGVLQPIIVRPASDPEGFEIVAGERRWRAAQRALLHALPAIVRELSDTEAAQIALIENVQRSDLNPVEEASAYHQLIETYGHSQERLAELIGKSRSYITNMLRLLKLPEQVLAALASGQISAGHARALVGSEHAVAYARQIIDRDLSVRDAERMVRNGAPPLKTRGPSPLKRSGDADTRALEAELSANLGMSVRIRHEPGHEGGELTIRYARLDELDLLCRVLAVIPRDADL